MRAQLSVLFILFSTLVFGQSKWEYGLNFNFNTSFIKPISSDTLTNKAGFGAGLMLERKFEKFSLQFNQAYTQTRFFDDFSNYTGISNAIDASLLVLHPLDAGRQTFLNYGIITTFNFQYDERYLSVFKQPIRNTQIQDNPFDYGIQLGVGLDLNPGTRLTINYMDFLSGKQTSSGVEGQIDYLQFGIQVRFNELLNSERIKNKNKDLVDAATIANKQVQALGTDGNGLLVFVIGTNDSKKASLFNNKSTQEKDALRIEKLNNIWNAIHTNYNFGSFVVTTDSLLSTESDNIRILTDDGTETFNTSEYEVYYAKIDELFLSENGQVKWGIFVFDSEMNRLNDPFPYFTPYRQLDQKFETSGTMIQSFNLRLKQYGMLPD